jgi:uncharacterized protein YbbC (DUF1343 family)/CubicO group peptidase (beta-lactamase class C family)
MQLTRVLLLASLTLAGDAAADARAVISELRSASMGQLRPLAFAQPAPARSDLAALSRFPVASELAIDRVMSEAIARHDVPGAAVIVGRRDGVLLRKVYGFAQVEPMTRPLEMDAVFDLASVTKAVATATSVALLVERGSLSYDDRVARFVPAFALPDKREITLRHLLTHTSGLPPVIPMQAFAAGYDAALHSIAAVRLGAAPGERYVYSDLGFIVLARVIERVAKQPVSAFASENLFAPLGLENTGFSLNSAARRRAVPTERVAGVMLAGTVHDPRARALGVTGHAGLFGTADELARFARMLGNGGLLDGVRVLGRETVRQMTKDQMVSGARVGLGWDLPDDTEHSTFSRQSFGHEGFTGTSLWIDPESDLFVVFLSSRLHPSGRGRAAPLAKEIRRIARAALHALPRTEDRGVGAGIDVLRTERFARLEGRRVALLTHDAARARDGARTTDLMLRAGNFRLVALLSPEHGVSAVENGVVGDTRDVSTALDVESLFGEKSEPSAELSRRVDTYVVDLQDAGARFYTYSSTLLGLMRFAARHGQRVVVLDRPNPIGGDRIEGPVSDPEKRSFIDPFPMPVRHGMTLGELAKMFRAELGLNLLLDVVPLSGWQRDQLWQDTGLRWFPPSPNLRTARQALLYPGIALFEQTNLSVGRGTPAPFERLGAPWLRAEPLLRISQPGVRLRSVSFVPDAGPYRGEPCQGVAFEVTDPRALRPTALAFELARALQRFPEWERNGMLPLLGSAEVFAGLERGGDVEALIRPRLTQFRELRGRYLLY